MRTLCKTSKFIVYSFFSERKTQVVIEQTRFLSTVFLCNEFKLENIYSGANFCGKNVSANFHLRELIFADHWTEKSQKLEPAKISCRTVVHLKLKYTQGKAESALYYQVGNCCLSPSIRILILPLLPQGPKLLRTNLFESRLWSERRLLGNLFKQFPLDKIFLNPLR